MTGSTDAHIVVVLPHAEQTRRPDARPIAPRLPSLQGVRIGFVHNGFVATGILHDALREALAGHDVTLVTEHKRYWRPLDADRLAALVEAVDALVGGIGQTPPSSTWAVQDAVAFERRGIPTVTLATSIYEELVADAAVNDGMPHLRRVILPHPLEGRPEAEVRAVAAAAVDAIVAALTDGAASPVVGVAMPEEA